MLKQRVRKMNVESERYTSSLVGLRMSWLSIVLELVNQWREHVRGCLTLNE
jgi:hypothetical protein